MNKNNCKDPYLNQWYTYTSIKDFLGDLSDVKQTPSFCHIIFLGNQGTWEEEVNMEPHAVELPGRMVGPIWCLLGPIAAIFTSTESSWPKTNY
jgi:hypothetical protein